MPTLCACGCGLPVATSGAYRKGHNPPGVDRDPSGRIKALNDKWSPINNPIRRAKKQKREREEATERIAKFPNRVEELLSSEAATDVAKTILEKQATAIVPRPILEVLAKEIGIDDVSRLPLDDWLTLNQLFTHAAVSFYIGYTRQSLPAEALCWIGPRGSEKRDKNGDFIATGTRNRPTLLWGRRHVHQAVRGADSPWFPILRGVRQHLAGQRARSRGRAPEAQASTPTRHPSVALP